MDVFEVVNVTVRTFDQKTIALGSSRFYKSSNHLLVNSKQNAKVPREGTYDAEMYRILTNWLTKVHGYEITGQWHLDGICDDGGYHHFYCDLTIKEADVTNPIAVIEILASGSVPKIKKHFDQVSNDQEKRLNVMHFWHDMDFKSIRMSAKFRDAIGKYCEIIKS
ncbi:16179_t:CDS:2 [Gigaspora margarita]|uniref:16179_t:CDS:1 n=1 Tax=Gigaspora margarita TaxID=4874 RepID=A0ABN7W0V3_GIGMA|nr:16179_t:CDS:2 [Gigaspora margarita]